MFNDLKSLLPKTVKRAGISKKIEQQEILKLFQKTSAEFLGDEIAKKIKPLYLFDKVLTVVTLDPETLKMMKKKEREIMRRINEKTGEYTVMKIRYLA